jgi:hypothetical protein
MQLRIWDPEIECDLPCHEDIFDAMHPFTHPDFSFKRSLTARQAFDAVFATAQAERNCGLGLTMLDSFILIHSKLSPEAEPAVHGDSLTAICASQCFIDSPTPHLRSNCLDPRRRKNGSTLTAASLQTYEWL